MFLKEGRKILSLGRKKCDTFGQSTQKTLHATTEKENENLNIVGNHF